MGANVIAIEKESKVLDGFGISSDSGFYRISLKKNTDYQVKISFIGFQQIELDLNLSEDFEKNFILEEQAEALDELMAENDSTISAMIALEVDDEVLISRLLERGKTSGRVDDSTKDIIQNRISEYYKKTAILKNFYTKKNRYFGVNGEGSVKVITDRLSSVIESL